MLYYLVRQVINSLCFNWPLRGENAAPTTFLRFSAVLEIIYFQVIVPVEVVTGLAFVPLQQSLVQRIFSPCICLPVVFIHPFSFYGYSLDHQKAHVGSLALSSPSLPLLSLQATRQSERHEIPTSRMDNFSDCSSSIKAVILVIFLHEYLNGKARKRHVRLTRGNRGLEGW